MLLQTFDQITNLSHDIAKKIDNLNYHTIKIEELPDNFRKKLNQPSEVLTTLGVSNFVRLLSSLDCQTSLKILVILRSNSEVNWKSIFNYLDKNKNSDRYSIILINRFTSMKEYYLASNNLLSDSRFKSIIKNINDKTI